MAFYRYGANWDDFLKKADSDFMEAVRSVPEQREYFSVS